MPGNGFWACPTRRNSVFPLCSHPPPGTCPLPGPADTRSPKDTHHNPCPSRWSPPAARQTFCCLQDGAKSPFRLKIPCDWTRLGGHPRQTERNPGQAPAARAAGSCQAANRDLPGAAPGEGSAALRPQPFPRLPLIAEMLWEPHGQSQHLAPGAASPRWGQGQPGTAWHRSAGAPGDGQ